MSCTECASDRAKQVEIEYTDGSQEVLGLCADCRAAFEEGGFVEAVSPVDE